MTNDQEIQFNRMLAALKIISEDYQTSEQLRNEGAKQVGLDYEEALEMAYENIQELATRTIKGIKPLTHE